MLQNVSDGAQVFTVEMFFDVWLNSIKPEETNLGRLSEPTKACTTSAMVRVFICSLASFSTFSNANEETDPPGKIGNFF